MTRPSWFQFRSVGDLNFQVNCHHYHHPHSRPVQHHQHLFLRCVERQTEISYRYRTSSDDRLAKSLFIKVRKRPYIFQFRESITDFLVRVLINTFRTW